MRFKYITKPEHLKPFPFDSKKKRMTTRIKSDHFPTGYRLFLKGGAENVKNICKDYINPDTGKEVAMDDNEIIYIGDSIEKFNKNILWLSYVCYKDITEEQFNDFEHKNEADLLIGQYDLVLIAGVGIRNSLRDGVKEAVEKCKEAKMNVILVTGDNIVTAVEIGKDCHILEPSFDLDNMKPEDIEEDPDLINNIA